MTVAQKLDALIDAVEAGQNPAREIVRSAMPQPLQVDGLPIGLLIEWIMAADDMRAMGAALVLHNALLPEWGWRVQQYTHGRGIAAVAKYPTAAVDVFADTHARAWLLAILKAYRAQVAQ